MKKVEIRTERIYKCVYCGFETLGRVGGMIEEVKDDYEQRGHPSRRFIDECECEFCRDRKQAPNTTIKRKMYHIS